MTAAESMIEWGGHHRWTTTDELNFLAEIGTHRQEHPNDHTIALRQYRDSMRVRTRWNEIDRYKVGEFIDAELSQGRTNVNNDRNQINRSI